MEQETRKKRQFHSTLVVSIVIAVAVALLTFFYFTVVTVESSSMTPSFKAGDVLLTVKGPKVKRGNVVAFYHGNNVLVRRCIGLPGDEVDIREDGNVYVNGDKIDEPYLEGVVTEVGDVEFPYQIPDFRYFVLGDNRETAPDSRSYVVGCISPDQLTGKVLFRVWPINRIAVLPGSQS